MIASIGNNGIENIKAGSVIMVSDVQNGTEAQQEINRFLAEQNKEDLGYFAISDQYFILFHKSATSTAAVA
ncbi:hypothetical protein [Dyadobacter tibetensis]|uniref:hypothetical protein n=1 Tax=Dyadobacter tibetensis TaxID=1211851 RepID=UPI000471E5C5|nr:hypothetical protein [Dyadobacter tibetensis]